MSKWQWNLNGKWIKFSEKNNQILNARFEEPSMTPLFFKNTYGELWGLPELRMKFRFYQDEESVASCVRRYSSTDLTIYSVNGETLLPPSACRLLFEERTEETVPRQISEPVNVGTELFMAKRGKIYQQLRGKLTEREWKPTPVTEDQYDEMSKARFTWEFNGPFRVERMQKAVDKTCRDISEDQRRKLSRLFTVFDADNEDATEYGPYQFPDFLCAHGMEAISCQVMDNYHTIPLNGWQKFGGIVNSRIERKRQSKMNAITITVRGQNYMLLFDSGGGASGQPPVIIRPVRYNKILSSIEEQFSTLALRELFDALMDCGVNPVQFLRCAEPEELLPVDGREKLMEIFHKVTHSNEYIATRIQQFMPALLDKYKECDIRLSQEEKLNPKRLCRKTAATIDSGLRVPTLNHSFKELIIFIQQTQSWVVDKPANGECQICLSSNCVVLHHCGSAVACLKCWVDTLVETKTHCPFCRQPVESGQLVYREMSQPSPKKRKTKKRARFNSADDVLSVIRQDDKYSDITLNTVKTMRKWFTILVRKQILDLSQLPAQSLTEKNLTSALTEFQIL